MARRSGKLIVPKRAKPTVDAGVLVQECDRAAASIATVSESNREMWVLEQMAVIASLVGLLQAVIIRARDCDLDVDALIATALGEL